MKQADMNPMRGRAFEGGQRRTVGAWSFSDGFTDEGFPIRYVWHYHTMMFTFVSEHLVPNVLAWDVHPISLGHGSVSDQMGCNRIIGNTSPFYYSRKGGAEWVLR
jgi:hypothetical protein